jgi:glycerol-3-phosphate dehydrogenase subunit B
MYDILVIGGGLAGTIAALTARARGAKVALASRSWGATALSTGAIDIAYSPALSPLSQSPRSIAEHVMDIIAHRPRHPYGVLGLERSLDGVRRGFATLQKCLSEEGLSLGDLDLEADNLALPSALGAVLPAATALASHLGLDLSRRVSGTWGLVQLHGDPYFDSSRVGRGLSYDVLALTGAPIELRPLPVAYDASKGPVMTARGLDDIANVDALVAMLAPKVKGLSGIIVPPVIGFERHSTVLRYFSEALGMPVVEALAQIPSVPGMRLQFALERARKRAKVDALGEIGSVVTEGQRVQAVRTSDALDIRAQAFVLATGRFVSGGVVFGERCREALFDLPVVTELGPLEEDSPLAVVRETPMESHPLMAAGVPVTRELSPVREGRVAFTNLFAAGMVIGGFASRYALCADGVALASGVLAAEAAHKALT